jgi:hypothetical protein
MQMKSSQHRAYEAENTTGTRGRQHPREAVVPVVDRRRPVVAADEGHDIAVAHIDGEEALALQEEVDDVGFVRVYEREDGDLLRHPPRLVGVARPDLGQARPGMHLPPRLVGDIVFDVERVGDQRPDDNRRLLRGLVALAGDVHEPQPAGAHPHEAVPLDLFPPLRPVIKREQLGQLHVAQLWRMIEQVADEEALREVGPPELPVVRDHVVRTPTLCDEGADHLVLLPEVGAGAEGEEAGAVRDNELGDHVLGASGAGDREEADASDGGDAVLQERVAPGDAHGGAGRRAGEEAARHDEDALGIGIQVEADGWGPRHVEEDEVGVVGGGDDVGALVGAVGSGIRVGACGQGELREVRRDDELHGDVHGVLDGVVLHEGDAAQEDPRRPRRHFDRLSRRRDGLVGVWRGRMAV